MRVVSLLPSATEIVSALGHGTELVGRSDDCDYPAAVRELPVVMRARDWNPEASSSAIDSRVVRTRSNGASLYELNVARLQELRPDVILTQDLCGVCSVTEAEVHDACRAAGVQPEIVSLTPQRLDDVWQSVEVVGRALHDAPAGEQLAARLRRRASVRQPPDGTPQVAVVEWLDPPILAGLWSPDQVVAGGGRPIGPPAGEPGARTTWEEIERSRPDLLIVTPCSFPVDRTRRELADPELRRAAAGPRPRLGTYLADEAYFSRPGPRLADGVELVRALLAGSPGPFPMDVARWPNPAPRIAA